MVTISDAKKGVKSITDITQLAYYEPQVLTANDYYPFGMQMPGRNFTSSSSSYRYGFNGKENDNEVNGDGNIYDYGFRIYNPRIGKFLSVDPLASKYPWYSPYHFAGNNPIVFNDLDGQEPNQAIWFAKHPKAAQTFKKNSEIANEVARDPNLKLKLPTDGEQDAFRHAFWMALNAQKEGAPLAVDFGQAHEEDGDANDSRATQMDMFNNFVGAQIGTANPEASREEIIIKIIAALKAGALKIIFTDQEGVYLNENGEELITDGEGNWQAYKVVIKSNTPLPKKAKPNPKTETSFQHWKRGVLPGKYDDPNKVRKEEINKMQAKQNKKQVKQTKSTNKVKNG